MDISRLFDSDTETEPGVLSEPATPTPDNETTPDPGDGDDAQPGDGVDNFSTTARKGSSSNASPMSYPSREPRNVPEAMDPLHPSYGDDDDDDSGKGASSSVPPATRRELQRLADFNQPGLSETSASGRRPKRHYGPKRNYDDK